MNIDIKHIANKAIIDLLSEEIRKKIQLKSAIERLEHKMIIGSINDNDIDDIIEFSKYAGQDPDHGGLKQIFQLNNILDSNINVAKKFLLKADDENVIENFLSGSSLIHYDKFGGRFKELENRILKEKMKRLVVPYAKYVLKDRWPEGESLIVKDPHNAYRYANEIIKGRWLEAEPYIMKNQFSANIYAKVIMKKRWPEAEPYIKAGGPEGSWWPDYSSHFGNEDTKEELFKRFNSNNYDESDVDNLAELMAKFSKFTWKDFEKIKDKNILEKALLKSKSIHLIIQYSWIVKKNRWLEAEPIIKASAPINWYTYTTNLKNVGKEVTQEQVIKKIVLPPSEEMLFRLKYKNGRGLFKENDFEVYYDDGQLKFVQVSNLEKLKGILKALHMMYQTDEVEFQKYLKNGMAYFILDNENGIISIIRLADSKIIDSNNKAIDKDNPELYNRICKILEQVFEIDDEDTTKK